jgi:RNA polymerase sigma factor (sigma-70 family)
VNRVSRFRLTSSETDATKEDVRPDLDRTPDLDPDALIERARAQDPAAFQALFRLHVARIHRLVHRLMGRSSDVDDVVQMVFVEGFRSLPAFRGEALFSTWLARIAVRVTGRHRRRPALRLVPLDAAETAGRDTPGPEQAVDVRRRLEQLDALLGALSSKRRAAFVLHVLEGHPVEEVAAMLGASVSAVKVRIHDARREIERQARRDPLFASYFQPEGAD